MPLGAQQERKGMRAVPGQNLFKPGLLLVHLTSLPPKHSVSSVENSSSETQSSPPAAVQYDEEGNAVGVPKAILESKGIAVV